MLKKDLIPKGINKDWAEDFKLKSIQKGRTVKSGDMMNNAGAFDFEIYNASMDFGLAWNEKSWEIQEEVISSFKDLVTSEGSDFKVFLFPIHIQVFGTVEDYYPQQKFLEICKNLSIDCRDLRPALAEAGKIHGREMYFDHCHFGVEGNKAVAMELYEWLN